MDDITTDTTTWTPIGINGTYSFNGSFDGGWHTIIFTAETTITNSNAGFFGSCENYNLPIKNLNINWQGKMTAIYSGDGNFYVGGISGYAQKSIINCTVKGIISASYTGSNNKGSGYFAVGGVVGNLSWRVENCYNSATISPIFEICICMIICVYS